MTRVIHTGDTHLGYRQYHAPARREDFLDAFRQVAEDAVADDVDAVVHAGDLFHDRQPDLGDIMGAIEVLERLREADIPVLAIVGNHETKRDAQWLDLFESLGLATRLGPEPVVVDDVAVYGLDFVPRSQRDRLEYDFEPHDADHAALVAHGLFQPFDYGDWDATEILEAAPVEFDAMLLGDNHDPGTKEVDGTWLTYCGSTERASASEREDRGYNIVTFDGDVQVTRRGIPTREFVYVDVDLAAEEGGERVRERVGQHDLEDAVVIVSITGDGEPVTPAAIEEFARERGALVTRVTDDREFERDRETNVSFADPDEAVRERIRDLGLSGAARDMDETIRASKVADSNVADEVQSRVADLVEEGDPDAFEPAEPGEEPDEGEAAEGSEDTAATEADGGDEAEPSEDDAGDDAEPSEDDAGDGSADEVEKADATAESAAAEDPEDQSTMEEYL